MPLLTGYVPQETRLQHLSNYEGVGLIAFPAVPPLITHRNSELSVNYGQLEGSTVAVGGRIEAIRKHGKLTFYDIRDESGTVQVLRSKRDKDDTEYDFISGVYDTGDIISVRGTLGKTKTGEVTVRAGQGEIEMLAKAISPPPDNRYLGTETRRSQRYLDLMVDPKSRERFRKRSLIIQKMREGLLAHGLLEVETPVLDSVYGGAAARPFTTHINALDKDMYMRIAPELYLKRVVAGLMGGVFEFSRNFRNEGLDATHHPEFTVMEAYIPNADYNTVMELSEKMFEKIAIDLYGTTQVPYGDQIIDFKAPWRRLTINDGLRLAYNIDPSTISDEDLQQLAIDQGVIKVYHRRGDLLLELFENAFDGKLIQPTFVLDYPRETSPLAKGHRTDPDLAERFECSIGGMEVMNAFTELNDPRVQRALFEAEQKQKEAGDAEAMPTDTDFITAMEYGFPPMGGIGISIDRMAMLLTNTPNIRDTILFPLRRVAKEETEGN